jgi:hypothetical protein
VTVRVAMHGDQLRRLGKLQLREFLVGLGRGRGEAIRTIFYSDRQLPPGHDPGADSGEAPNGRQRGSRPSDILVECHGHLRPLHEVRT